MFSVLIRPTGTPKFSAEQTRRIAAPRVSARDCSPAAGHLWPALAALILIFERAGFGS